MTTNIKRNKKCVVQTLCVGNSIEWTKTTLDSDIPMYTSVCPKASCIKKIHYQRKNGCTTPYGHLEACIGSEGVSSMMNEFEQQLKNKRTSGRKLIRFKPKDGLNERDKAIIKWVTIILKKYMPVTHVEDSTMR